MHRALVFIEPAHTLKDAVEMDITLATITVSAHSGFMSHKVSNERIKTQTQRMVINLQTSTHEVAFRLQCLMLIRFETYQFILKLIFNMPFPRFKSVATFN